MEEQIIVRHRRGRYSDFDPSKVLPGEIVMITEGDPSSSNGKGVYAYISDGALDRLITQDELHAFGDIARAAAGSAARAEAEARAAREHAEDDMANASAMAESMEQAKASMAELAEQVQECLASAQNAVRLAEQSQASVSEAAEQVQECLASALEAVQKAENVLKDVNAMAGGVEAELYNVHAFSQHMAEDADQVKAETEKLMKDASGILYMAQQASENAAHALNAVDERIGEMEHAISGRRHVADAGSGVIGDIGEACICLDKAISPEYHIFLQKEGEGEAYVLERADAFFIVAGTKGMKFSWMAIA